MFISCALLFFLPGARSLLSGLHAHRVQLPPPAVSAARPSLELRSASNSGARPSSLRPIAPVDLYKSIRDSQLIGLSRYTKEILLYNFDGGTICSVVILKEWLGIHRVAAAEISKGLPIFGIGVGHSTYDKASDSGSHQVTPPHVDFADVSILVVELRTTIRCPDRERWS
ncbi:Sec14p-like phosphatidylinositol transfer family protein [Zea mays]|uniref:Sec14p-like phosphatidylinositol transfer family protein n=1 Tax=Zea mays TaxID=4577 RepID=A0A1D6IX62_MAIZE|nr:Sec14p-like phosphatidylinositol transfer family protein [Zea mays]